MTKTEMAQILGATKLLFGNQALTEAETNAWFVYFGNEDATQFKNAMLAAAKTGRFFPTPGEVQENLNFGTLPDVLRLSGTEALINMNNYDSPLLDDASNFADLAAYHNPTAQYSSPEELEKANQIHESIWKREFKERFESRRDSIRAQMAAGRSFEAAMQDILRHKRIIPKVKLPAPNRRTLE